MGESQETLGGLVGNWEGLGGAGECPMGVIGVRWVAMGRWGGQREVLGHQ